MKGEINEAGIKLQENPPLDYFYLLNSSNDTIFTEIPPSIYQV
jgi:hypothetical protein